VKVAILSDFHANLPALEAVWADLQAQRPDGIYCLGDLVGDGAHPNEVIDFIQAQAIPSVLGNYDEAVGFDLNDCGCVNRHPSDDRHSQRSLFWIRAQTSSEGKAFLRGLPLQQRVDLAGKHVLLVHGSPRQLNEYLYADRPRATFEQIAKVAGCDLLLFGHTHRPYQKQVGRTRFVNAGSVGLPRDGDPRAGYVLVHTGPRWSFEFRRVPYDVAAAVAAIRAAGLPPEVARSLETGGLAEAEPGRPVV
jgi:putative phosphoesterase